MNLDTILAKLLMEREELKGVSRPIIDAVVRETLDAISMLADDDTTVDQLVGEDWERCEACDIVILVLKNGFVVGDDLIPMCASCYEKEVASPSPSTN